MIQDAAFCRIYERESNLLCPGDGYAKFESIDTSGSRGAWR